LPQNEFQRFLPMIPVVFHSEATKEIKTSRNSLFWTILKITLLF
jgi:Na+(H+)/acetate symporter ActP